MEKKVKVKNIKKGKERIPYEYMRNVDPNDKFLSIFMPWIEKKHKSGTFFLSKSIQKMYMGQNNANDKVWGQYISKYFIEAFGLENIQNIRGLYEAGLLSYEGTKEEFEEELKFFEDRFKTLEKETFEILLHRSAKEELIPYFEKYNETLAKIYADEDFEKMLDVQAYNDFTNYIKIAINSLNEYLNYVDNTSQEKFNEEKAKKLMGKAIGAVKIFDNKRKEFEFEVEKAKIVFFKVKDDEARKSILKSCKYFRLNYDEYNYLMHSMVDDLEIALPKNAPLNNFYGNLARCNKEDYDKYLDFLLKLKSKEFSAEGIRDKKFSDNWLTEEVSQSLMNNQSFQNVIKNQKFENIDELLNIAQCVFDGVNQAIENSPLKDFVSLRFKIDGRADNKVLNIFAQTVINDNIQEIRFMKEPFLNRLNEKNDINLLIYTIITVLHESFHAIDCAMRGTDAYLKPDSTNAEYNMLMENGYLSDEKFTNTDYYLLSCLSPSLVNAINDDAKEYGLPPSVILNVYGDFTHGILDRDQKTEISAHKFSSVTGQAIFKRMADIAREKGDEELSKELYHHGEYDIYNEAYQIDPQHLEDREKMDNIWSNLLKDLQEVNSVDAIEHMLSNHFFYAKNAEEAKELQKKSYQIFKAYYLNLSDKNKEKLKNECISSLKLKTLATISDVLVDENNRKQIEYTSALNESSDNKNKKAQNIEKPVEQVLTFTGKEIIEMFETANKFNIRISRFVSKHYEKCPESFKEAFEYYAKKGDLNTMFHMLPNSTVINNDDKKFFIEKSVEQLFSKPEAERNDIEIEFFVSDLILYVESYREQINDENLDKELEELKNKLRNEEDRINQAIDYEMNRPSRKQNQTNVNGANLLSIPETSSTNNISESE